jgi:hypothetical protein
MFSQPSHYPISEWISFLRQYGPIPRNDNMYDEVIQRTLQRKKLKPITFETEYLNELLDNFRSSEPKSVILTGTAGDGKTYYCREIWKEFGGSMEDWQQDDKVYQMVLGEKKLVVIKDLSELIPEKKQALLPQIADAILGRDLSTIYLIAANDGQLIEAWSEKGQSEDVNIVSQVLENLLIKDLRETDDFQLKLYNLSRQSSFILFPRILDAVLNHPGWGTCNQCGYQSQGCPIWQNKLRLEGVKDNEITRRRLTDLLALCELNDMHLPVRQLLLLVANILLGHPDVTDKLMNCKQVAFIISSGSTSQASLYRNILGENLSERRQESTEVFQVLRSFGIGIETSNQIDNILIFGADDPELDALYQGLVLIDSFYGADLKYQAQQRSYLEGDIANGRQDFLNTLQSQRQRLFFTIPDEQITDMKIWDLTVFHYAGEYLNDLCKTAQNGKKTSKLIVSRLVKGLNRIFTGLLIDNQDELILATSGSYSQAKISRVYEDSISVPRKRGESVSIELDDNGVKPSLVVNLAEVEPIRFQLTMIRYEYLSRVAEGALPSSFSQECYEDVLAFKTQVLKQLTIRKSLESIDGEEFMNIRLLEVNRDGLVNPRSLQVNFQ